VFRAKTALVMMVILTPLFSVVAELHFYNRRERPFR